MAVPREPAATRQETRGARREGREARAGSAGQENKRPRAERPQAAQPSGQEAAGREAAGRAGRPQGRGLKGRRPRGRRPRGRGPRSAQAILEPKRAQAAQAVGRAGRDAAAGSCSYGVIRWPAAIRYLHNFSYYATIPGYNKAGGAPLLCAAARPTRRLLVGLLSRCHLFNFQRLTPPSC
jgi:hypothetical protein